MNQMEMAMNYVRAMENNVSPNSVGKKSLTFIMDALKEKQERDEKACEKVCEYEEQIYQYQNDWDECEWEGLGIEDDLISRRAMYIALYELGGCDAKEDYYKGYDSGIDAAISALQCAPTMYPEPVRYGKLTGKWIEKRKKTLLEGLYEVSYYCSCCGNKVYGKYNYCSDCGAKMDLEESE